MKSVKMFGKSVPMLAIMMIGMLTIGASAALLKYYGTVTMSTTVQQSVTIDSSPDTITGAIAGNTYCFPHTISNAAEVDVEVELVNDLGSFVGIDVSYRDHLRLTSKDEDWSSTEDMIADLCYTATGQTFDYSIHAKDLEEDTEYVLIYYADKTDRFAEDKWGGDEGFLLGTFTSNAEGIISTSGSAGPGSMPYVTDWNAGSEADYTKPPDNYDHATGAKLWLVPSDHYDTTKTKVLNWVPDEFLFETDLITYTQGAVDNHRIIPAESSVLIQICYEFDAALEPGITYKITTYVNVS